LAGRFSSEDSQRRSRAEMALNVEGVVDRGMHAEEALGRSSRFETAASCALVAAQADTNSRRDCSAGAPAHERRSAATAGTPPHRSAVCQLPAISAQTPAF